MTYGIIDIGSNTIRLAIFKDEQEIYNTADYAGLINYVSEGNISLDGIMIIVKALNKMKKICEENGCDSLYAFSTASLRDIQRKAELVDFVHENTGIKMHMLSGEEEAKFDFLGLSQFYDITDGVAFDLGGGSCQIINVFHKNIIECHSFPIGSMRLYRDFVEDTLPNEFEADRISKEVLRNISHMPLLKNLGISPMYVMGGAGKSILSLYNKINNSSKISLKDFELEALKNVTVEQLEKYAPKRITTIIPAIYTILEILKYGSSNEIIPVNCGVRDGVLQSLKTN